MPVTHSLQQSPHKLRNNKVYKMNEVTVDNSKASPTTVAPHSQAAASVAPNVSSHGSSVLPTSSIQSNESRFPNYGPFHWSDANTNERTPWPANTMNSSTSHDSVTHSTFSATFSKTVPSSLVDNRQAFKADILQEVDRRIGAFQANNELRFNTLDSKIASIGDVILKFSTDFKAEIQKLVHQPQTILQPQITNQSQTTLQPSQRLSSKLDQPQQTTAFSPKAANMSPIFSNFDSTDLLSFDNDPTSTQLLSWQQPATSSGTALAMERKLRKFVTVPAFSAWIHNPKTWFELLEEEFLALNITSDGTKHNALINNLGNAATSSAVAMHVQAYTGPDRYNKLKEFLIQKYTYTTQQQIKKLFSQCTLGDKKPSEFYAELLNNAKDHTPPKTVLLLWAEALPQSIALYIDDEVAAGDVEKAIVKADRIKDRLKVEGAQIFDIKENHGEDPLVKIASSIAALSVKLDKHDSRPSKRSDSPTRSRSQSKIRLGHNRNLCYYHYKFKKYAEKCDAPCAWEDRKPKKALEKSLN
ncbi:hypothetical protein TKK_0001353 [Trichogramma kaykai]|uniref:DUF7041 domain-containing protein n=1 Tax=Trichogramma kaykai TaxID=54128 RepID=A0ABD2WS68_9HYME